MLKFILLHFIFLGTRNIFFNSTWNVLWAQMWKWTLWWHFNHRVCMCLLWMHVRMQWLVWCGFLTLFLSSSLLTQYALTQCLSAWPGYQTNTSIEHTVRLIDEKRMLLYLAVARATFLFSLLTIQSIWFGSHAAHFGLFKNILLFLCTENVSMRREREKRFQKQNKEIKIHLNFPKIFYRCERFFWGNLACVRFFSACFVWCFVSLFER